MPFLNDSNYGGPLAGYSGGGGMLSGRGLGLLDPQYALPIAAQLIGGATPAASFAGALGAAGPAIGDMRRRAAMNAYLKAHSGLNLTPEEQQLLQSDPELQRAFVARQLTPKPPITVGFGERVLDPNTLKPIDIGDAGGAYSPTSTEGADSNAILRGQRDPAFRATPEYQLAWNRTAAPKYIQGTDDNGNPALIPTQPSMAGLQPPTGAGAPASPAATPTADAGAAALAGGGPAPGVGKPITVGKAKPTESAARAAGLYTKAQPDYLKAVQHFDALKSVGNQALDYLGMPGRYFQSSEYKVARNAAKSVVRSYQYTASGAAAPEQEVEDNLALVLPDPADDAATTADKKARLTAMMDGMQIVAQGGRIPQEMVKRIGIEVSGPGVEPPTSAPAPGEAKEGDTAFDPKTNHRIVLKGGQWLDAQTGQPIQ